MRLTPLGRVVSGAAFAAWLVLVTLGLLSWTAAKDANNMKYWQECTTAGTCPGPPTPTIPTTDAKER